MQTKTINLYTIDELKTQFPKGYDNAIEKYQEQNDYYFLEECLTDDLSELLKENGITADKYDIRYSLSYCQGDGAMFELTNAVWSKYPNYYINVKHDGRYYHSNSKTIFMYDDEENYADDDIIEEFNQLYKTICAKLEKYGYSFIESENDETNIMENMNANDYTFTASGHFERA